MPNILHPFRVRGATDRFPVVSDHRLLSRSPSGCRNAFPKGDSKAVSSHRTPKSQPAAHNVMQANQTDAHAISINNGQHIDL